MTVDIKEKMKEEKEIKKRKFDRTQTTDVTSTVRFPLELRQEIASYCTKHGISFNAFILMTTKSFLKIADTA